MNEIVLSQIEESFNQLPLPEKLRLIERLVHNAQKSVLVEHQSFESQLAAMAADPEIQKELQIIEDDFALAETDGLRNL